jgi:YegS/Rv2252/BmrU family lipid kinase
MTQTAKALVLVNRTASGSEGGLDDGLNALRAAGIGVACEFADDPATIPRRIRDDRSADMVVIGGGDGTLSAALSELLAAGRPLGILPMGNANDLARTLEIPTDLLAACEIIAAGHRRRIDLGLVNGKHFFNVASIGLGPRIAEELHNDIKRRWGLLSYPIVAWKTLRQSRPFRVSVTAGGNVERFGTLQIAVGNGRFYGGGMTIVDDASIDNGRLALYSVNPLPLWKLALLFPIIRWGKHRAVDDVRLLHGTEFLIETKRPMPINIDGEVLSQTPASFEIVRGALEVFAPKARETGAPEATGNRAPR